MWSPTHVQVTVCRARGLLSKGKNGTNDCFVTISLGKEKFQTSVKLKSPTNLEWQEECELPIPSQGNTAEIVLTALHQNFIGVDEFLGMISLPLAQFDVYDRPRTKWYPLNSKPGQAGKNKSRGEIEVKVGFTVKSGSMLDLSKKEKHKGSFGHITQAAHNIGGSLMNLGGKDKKGNIKKLASTVGSKLRLNKKNGAGDDKEGRLSRHSSGRYSGKYSSGDPDPGVISEDDDEFRFDELSHKSSGSSLNLAGSSQASGQGSLENLGGGELLRQNSMKRSGSSVSSLQSRAVPSASSSSTNLAALAAANSAASKSPGGKSDWNSKLFGKQDKGEPVKPVVAEPVIRAPATSFSSAVPSSSVVLDQVPSIIIKDSFVVEEPSLSPPLVIEPSPKSRKAPAPPAPVADPPPPIKPRRKVEDEPITAPGEVDDSASWSRMQVPSLSFPVASTHDDHALSAPPVPKPRRSPNPPESLPPSTLPRQSLPEPVLMNPFDDEDLREPVALNPFDDEDDYEEEASTEDPGLVTLMEASNEDEEAALSEASVCQLLEEAIEGHEMNVKPDDLMEDEEEGGLVMQVRTPGAVELFSDDATSAENTIDIHLEQTIDLFDNSSGEEISPVERATTSRQLNNSSATTPPVQSDQPTHSNRGFFSTPRYTPETPMVTKNISVVRLDWMEHTDEEDGSQGFGGSIQTASTAGSEAALQATTKTIDSALPDEEEEEEPVDLEGARNRRLSSILPRPSTEFTPPQLLPVPELTDTPFVPTSATSSTSSAKVDLSWDSEFDIPLPGTPRANAGVGKNRRSMVPYDPVPILSPLGEEEIARRKKISLAPVLKPLSWNDTLDSTQSSPGSPFPEDSDEAEEKAAALAGAAQNSETQRMKMAASFHQRVVVGEDKPVNNVTPRDFHTPRDSPSTEDRQRLYQGKSREGLIGLLEERDKQISDLKDYIDSLLLRVIDTCPTVLQTPIKSKNSPQ